MSEIVSAVKAEPAASTPKDAATLSEYTPAQRTLEIAAIACFFVLTAWLAWRVTEATASRADWLLVAAGLFAGYVTADFTSGLVHWGFDTWGSIYTPLVGKAFIRPFREHHFDEMAMTRHDFIETNGNNSLVTLPVLGLAFLFPMEPGGAIGLVGVTYLVAISFATFLTNQIHAWSHMGDSVPKMVGTLQRLHLILPPEHHDLHHQKPHLSHYCITTGWLNQILNATNFFRILERVVTAVTGAQPREDDLA